MELPTNSVTSIWHASSDSVLLVALKILCNQVEFGALLGKWKDPGNKTIVLSLIVVAGKDGA